MESGETGSMSSWLTNTHHRNIYLLNTLVPMNIKDNNMIILRIAMPIQSPNIFMFSFFQIKGMNHPYSFFSGTRKS